MSAERWPLMDPTARAREARFERAARAIGRTPLELRAGLSNLFQLMAGRRMVDRFAACPFPACDCPRSASHRCSAYDAAVELERRRALRRDAARHHRRPRWLRCTRCTR